MNNYYTRLARESIKHFLQTGKIMKVPSDLDGEILNKKAGVFVSLHNKEDNSLRGCIGTFQPSYRNIAEEIIQNAVQAAFFDPRFPPLKEKELDKVKISVDILSPLEQVTSEKELNPKRFGILVVGNKSKRRGLLLPNIEGVKTLEQQLSIAIDKAGINPLNEEITLYRFTVKRYEE